MRLIYDSKDFVHHKVLKTLILTYVVLVLLSVPYQLIAEGEQTKKEKKGGGFSFAELTYTILVVHRGCRWHHRCVFLFNVCY